MAFSKFAKANLIKPDINIPIWDKVRDSAQALGSAFKTREASKISLKEYHPDNYMLSHCTIVASVDTEEGPGALGRQIEGSFQVERLYQDYYITPESSQYVNNNRDAWERKLLLSSFRTFVGGENYVEHLQIPEMSKGKILDAAARDIGDSVYIDILVATHRKHRPLIAAIHSGQLQTLSMGCTVAYTICTKCGNVASDQPQLCPHIKYEKGNKFADSLGTQRVVAELCGHFKDEPGSVKFIEASWVANPAFTGAVLRSILSPEEAAVYNQLHAPRIQVAFSSPARVSDPNLIAKAARRAFDLGQGQQEEFGGPTPKSEDKGPLDGAIDDLAKHIREKALQKVREEMKDEEETTTRSPNLNDTLIHEASKHQSWQKVAKSLYGTLKDVVATKRMLLGLLHYKHGGWQSVRRANTFSGREVLAISRIIDTVEGIPSIAGEARVYRTVLAVGGTTPYGNESTYLAACRRVHGRDLTETEKQTLIVKGKLFDLGL